MASEVTNQATSGDGLKLLIALAQVKAGKNLENLLNEIRQIVHPLYQSKERNP